MRTYSQSSRHVSPWPFYKRLRQFLWELAWVLLCTWTPKPCNFWRLLILRLFGATVHGYPFVHQRARIHHPWNLILHNKSCLGDRTHAYCLACVEIEQDACVAQEAYLCTGTHDLSDPHWSLQTAPIHVKQGAFIGARAFLLPGVSIGSKAIVGACAVVTCDVPSCITVGGNPARPID